LVLQDRIAAVSIPLDNQRRAKSSVVQTDPQTARAREKFN
jgi:hypothetical protein